MVSGRGQRLGLLAMRLRGLGVKGMAQAGLRQCCFWAARLQPKLQFAICISIRNPNPESRIPNPESRIPNPESRNPAIPQSRNPQPGSAAKAGANKRPKKRLYRTVLGALLLAKRERNRRWFAACGRRLGLRRWFAGVWRVQGGAGRKPRCRSGDVSGLLKVCNPQPAASNPQSASASAT